MVGKTTSVLDKEETEKLEGRGKGTSDTLKNLCAGRFSEQSVRRLGTIPRPSPLHIV